MTEPGETRIDPVVALLTSLASGDLSARGERYTDDDDLDAVMVGVNMLAEELGAHREELEQRVATRTAELEIARADALDLLLRRADGLPHAGDGRVHGHRADPAHRDRRRPAPHRRHDGRRQVGGSRALPGRGHWTTS
jgi:hypothetical protein